MGNLYGPVNSIGAYAGLSGGERREGMRVEMRVVEYWRFRDGKVCELMQ